MQITVGEPMPLSLRLDENGRLRAKLLFSVSYFDPRLKWVPQPKDAMHSCRHAKVKDIVLDATKVWTSDVDLISRYTCR